MTSNAGLGELVRELRATLETIGLGLVEGQPDRHGYGPSGHFAHCATGDAAGVFTTVNQTLDVPLNLGR